MFVHFGFAVAPISDSPLRRGAFDRFTALVIHTHGVSHSGRGVGGLAGCWDVTQKHDLSHRVLREIQSSARARLRRSTSPIMLTTLTAFSCASLQLNPNIPKGVLGPPDHFGSLQVCSQFLGASRECSVSGKPVEFEVVRLASRPACFHVGGLLSEAECDRLIADAERKVMQQATTAGGHERSGCGVAWLPVDSHEVASAVSVACEQLFLRPELLEASEYCDGGRFENLQVLKYTQGGEFKLHYDANEQAHRVITVLLYLNGVGETWFPLALRDPEDAAAVGGANPPRATALKAAEQLNPGREHGWSGDGLVVAPKKGDAVAFYNLLDNGSGGVDRLSLHAGLPAPDEKSVAALWYHADLKQGSDGMVPLAVGLGQQAQSYRKPPEGTSKVASGKPTKRKRKPRRGR